MSAFGGKADIGAMGRNTIFFLCTLAASIIQFSEFDEA
jgi:hypothetical protein